MHWYEGPNMTIKVGRSTATTLKIVTNCHQNMPIIRKKSDESGITPPYFPAIMKCHYPTFHCITSFNLTRCHLTRKKSSVSIDFSCQITLLQRSSSYLLSHDIAWLDQQLRSAINSLTFTVTYYRKLKRFLSKKFCFKTVLAVFTNVLHYVGPKVHVVVSRKKMCTDGARFCSRFFLNFSRQIKL